MMNILVGFSFNRLNKLGSLVHVGYNIILYVKHRGTSCDSEKGKRQCCKWILCFFGSPNADPPGQQTHFDVNKMFSYKSNIKYKGKHSLG